MLINLKSLVTSACYDKQHVCTYLQPFSHYMSQYFQNNVFWSGYPYLTLSFEWNPTPRGTKFCHEKLEILRQPMVKIVILAFTVLIQCQGVTDGQIYA